MKLRLTVDGKKYDVEVEVLEQDQLQGQSHAAGHASGTVPAGTAAVQPVAASTAAPSGPVDEEKVFRSPISGVVVSVPVEAGQAVKANDVLMVLEAMKMETVVTSPFDGTVSSINAGVGDAVQVKQVLVEFE